MCIYVVLSVDISVYLYIYCDVLVATNSNDPEKDIDKDIVNLVRFNEPFNYKNLMTNSFSPPVSNPFHVFVDIMWFIALLRCATIAPCSESGNNSLLRELSLGQQLNNLIFYFRLLEGL